MPDFNFNPAARARTLFALSSLLLLSACLWNVNTLPPLLKADEPPQQVTLLVPENLEIKSVDFSAGLYTDAERGTPTVHWDLGGRAFIYAHAVDKKTGEPYLLIYENVATRTMPIQIIRFKTRADPAPPG